MLRGGDLSLRTWYKQLEAAPGDWEVRLMLADWLEENDHPLLAAGQRWQVEKKKRPRGYEGDTGWRWFAFPPGGMRFGFTMFLPHSLWQALCGLLGKERYEGAEIHVPPPPLQARYVQFPTLALAESALAEALDVWEPEA